MVIRKKDYIGAFLKKKPQVYDPDHPWRSALNPIVQAATRKQKEELNNAFKKGKEQGLYKK